MLLLLGGCSVKRMALNAVADELSAGTGGGFTSDEDLQFVGESLPFALKLMESIHAGVPDHAGLLETLASGFTQYGVVYVQWPADQLKYTDYEGYRLGLDRARGFFLRANRYAMRGLERAHPGISERLLTEPTRAVKEAGPEDVPLMFWAAASWLAAINTTFEDPELLALFPIAAELLGRCLELDPAFDNGGLHEVMISVAPSLPGPDPQGRSREHYERAVEIQGGSKAGPHVSMASLAVKRQDRAEFERLLERALELDPTADPDNQLANLYAQ
jgi:hypothetical protein